MFLGIKLCVTLKWEKEKKTKMKCVRFFSGRNCEILEGEAAHREKYVENNIFRERTRREQKSEKR